MANHPESLDSLSKKEQEIKELERRVKLLLDNITSVIGYWSKDLINLQCNLAYTKFFGKTPEQILGHHMKDLMDESFLKIVRPYVEEVLKGTPQTFEYEIKSPINNNVKYTVVEFIPDIITNTVVGFFAIVTDVTPMKNREIDLKEAQETFQMGSWQMDLETQKITWSDEIFKIFNHNKKAGPPSYEEYLSYIHPDYQADIIQAVTECIQEGKPYTLKHRLFYRERPQEIAWIEGRGRAIKNDMGKIIRLAGTVRVITEEVETKRLLDLERAKSMQNAKLASLGEMAGGIAHEINNPLAIMQSNTRLLLKAVSENTITTDEIIKKLEKVLSTSSRIAKIVKGMKSFSRNGDKDPFIPILVRDLVENALSLCSERLKSDGILLNLGKIPEDLYLECRSTQIEQVIMNLISNARDAVESLTEKWVKLEVTKLEKEVEILITDSGKGIAPEIVDRMLQPFYTTKIVGKGTGLGLSISKGIVEEHKGTILYNAATGNTQFVIALPIKQK
jgi:PAS domain S-box-containing protein